ncbi:unnamed protein product [Ceratitis capitata]|uniref:(Mediterranean fruit fly) hypothetical protein n=1 Tax=Ceratitis capitata TaxID=7213 RepID=A0A811UMD7_CERCA|nr:unnamed protein product [Ceratitis capitata]
MVQCIHRFGVDTNCTTSSVSGVPLHHSPFTILYKIYVDLYAIDSEAHPKSLILRDYVQLLCGAHQQRFSSSALEQRLAPPASNESATCCSIKYSTSVGTYNLR